MPRHFECIKFSLQVLSISLSYNGYTMEKEEKKTVNGFKLELTANRFVNNLLAQLKESFSNTYEELCNLYKILRKIGMMSDISFPGMSITKDYVCLPHIDSQKNSGVDFVTWFLTLFHIQYGLMW